MPSCLCETVHVYESVCTCMYFPCTHLRKVSTCGNTVERERNHCRLIKEENKYIDVVCQNHKQFAGLSVWTMCSKFPNI